MDNGHLYTKSVDSEKDSLHQGKTVGIWLESLNPTVL